MPEHAAFAVSFRCLCGRGYRFPHGKILMIRTEYFRVTGKTNEVLDYIKQPRLVEHSFKEGIKLSILCIFITTVFRLPLHKAVFT